MSDHDPFDGKEFALRVRPPVKHNVVDGTHGVLPPYQFNDNMRAAMNQHAQVYVDAILSGTGMLEVKMTESERAEAILVMNRMIDYWKIPAAAMDDARDSTQPIPRKAEVIEPSLMAKKISEW